MTTDEKGRGRRRGRLRKWLRDAWVFVAVPVLVVLFLLGEVLHGAMSPGIRVGGQGNQWQNIMQYTAHWEGLPPDYPRPFQKREHP